MNKLLRPANPFWIVLITMFLAGVMPATSLSHEEVTVLNFPRAETDNYIKVYAPMGAFGNFFTPETRRLLTSRM